MLFPHEQNEESIKYHENAIKELKEQKNDMIVSNHYYDIAALWKEQKPERLASYHNNLFAVLHIHAEDTLLDLHNFLDEVEETILIGYELDITKTKIDYNGQSYYYTKDQYTVNIDIRNNNCSITYTGKMIQEIKVVCSLER